MLGWNATGGKNVMATTCFGSSCSTSVSPTISPVTALSKLPFFIGFMTNAGHNGFSMMSVCTYGWRLNNTSGLWIPEFRESSRHVLYHHITSYRKASNRYASLDIKTSAKAAIRLNQSLKRIIRLHSESGSCIALSLPTSFLGCSFKL